MRGPQLDNRPAGEQARLGCEVSGELAGGCCLFPGSSQGPVAGFPVTLAIMELCGTYEGTGSGRGGPAHVATWRRIDHCAAPSVSTAGLVTTSVARCPIGRSVELITIAGAGHQWPGSIPDPLAQRLLHVGPPSRALNATQVIWQFFAAHPKPAGSAGSN